jgi:hypothetical protein
MKKLYHQSRSITHIQEMKWQVELAMKLYFMSIQEVRATEKAAMERRCGIATPGVPRKAEAATAKVFFTATQGIVGKEEVATSKLDIMDIVEMPLQEVAAIRKRLPIPMRETKWKEELALEFPFIINIKAWIIKLHPMVAIPQRQR